jgi:hypothetical protein
VLERFHRTYSFPEHLRSVFEAEVSHNPKKQHVTLVRRERLDQVGHALCGHGVERFCFSAWYDAVMRLGHELGIDPPPGNPPAVIDVPRVRDAEDERPKVRLLTAEPIDPAEDLQKHLTGQIFSVRDTATTQVGHHGGAVAVPDLGECP